MIIPRSDILGIGDRISSRTTGGRRARSLPAAHAAIKGIHDVHCSGASHGKSEEEALCLAVSSGRVNAADEFIFFT